MPPQHYNNPCLTLHQPWASLLVYGIKRIEGRSWPAPISGSVKVVGCVKQAELVSWESLPNGVRLEGQTDFCWLCEEPQRLVVPFEMRGWQGVYNLEKKIAADAIRALRPISGPSPVKFPLPDPADPSSLRPGAIESLLDRGVGEKANLIDTPMLKASIADAREAANQFRKKEHSERSLHSLTKVPANDSISSSQNLSSPFQGRDFKRQHTTSTFSSKPIGEATSARGSSSSVRESGR